jgi:hypothetical protein
MRMIQDDSMRRKSCFRAIRGQLVFLRMDHKWYEMPGGYILYRSALCKIIRIKQNWIKIKHPSLGYVSISMKDRISEPNQ